MKNKIDIIETKLPKKEKKNNKNGQIFNMVSKKGTKSACLINK